MLSILVGIIKEDKLHPANSTSFNFVTPSGISIDVIPPYLCSPKSSVPPIQLKAYMRHILRCQRRCLKKFLKMMTTL